MKKVGFFKDGELLQRFDTINEAFEMYKAQEDPSDCVFRLLKFQELTEEERLVTMEVRLTELTDFLNRSKASGRSFYSHTEIYEEELKWLIAFARKEIKGGGETVEVFDKG